MKRREFIKQVSAVGLVSPLIIPSTALGDERKAPASERVTVAAIGYGSRGGSVFRDHVRCSNAQVVAVCDCFKSRRERGAKACDGKAVFDFRDILADSSIDAVIVATPDHWHVPIAIAAAQAKKSCYVEKPLGLTLEQDLLCEKVFAENGVKFQYGTQQRSQTNCLIGCEMVRRGRIGKVKSVKISAPNGGTGGNPTPCPIPEDLGEQGYQRWIGPAAMTPYCADRCRPHGTYWINDYSIGYLGGWGAHPLDLLIWGLGAPTDQIITVEGTGKIGSPLYNTVYDWEMNITVGDIDMTFTHGGGDSTKFIGEDGEWINVYRAGLGASKPSLIENPELSKDPILISSSNHAQNFIDAIRFDRTPVSCLKDALASDLISHLCDIAVRTNSKVSWDCAKKSLVNPTEPQAALLSRPSRGDWAR